MLGLSINDLITSPYVQTGALAVFGVIVTQLTWKRYPIRRLASQVSFFFILTGLLFYHHIVPYEVAPETTPLVERTFIAMAKIVWWLYVAWVLTSCARAFLILERRPREGKLIQDLAVALIYLGSTLSIVAYVFQAPIGTLIATSGVFAIILGMALQSTLSDVFSGIALNMSHAYAVGDWLVLNENGIEGRVIETNWRATHLLNGSNDLVIIPNNSLARAHLINLSSPNRTHGVRLNVQIVPTTVPSAISDVFRTVLLSSNSIMASPPPKVEIKSLTSEAIELELSFRVRDFTAAAAAKHEVYDLIYRHTKASGLSLAPAKEVSPTDSSIAGRSTALRLLDALPIFASLTEEEKEELAHGMKRRIYRKSDIIAEQGVTLTSLFIIRSGVVSINLRGDTTNEFSRLSPGDYFGEFGLFTGSEEIGSIHALTSVVAYEVDKTSVAKLMQERPSIADEVSVTLSRLAKMANAGNSAPQRPFGTASSLVGRIKQMLGVPVE